MLAIYKLVYRIFFSDFFFIYKNLHIEPFNTVYKMVCFCFLCSSSLLKLGKLAEYFSTFYRFWCHYPFITYPTLNLVGIWKKEFALLWGALIMMIAQVYQNLVQILVGLENNKADVIGRHMNVNMKVLCLPTNAKFRM